MNATDTNRLEKSTEVKIGDKIYIVERHFSGERDVKTAIYAVVRNEADRLMSQEKNK